MNQLLAVLLQTQKQLKNFVDLTYFFGREYMVTNLYYAVGEFLLFCEIWIQTTRMVGLLLKLVVDLFFLLIYCFEFNEPVFVP